MKKTIYNFNWDLNEKDELKKALWMASQYRQFCMKLMEGKTFGELPDLGTDEGGSSTAFDWWMILEFESRKMLDAHGIPREAEIPTPQSTGEGERDDE